MTSGSEGHIPAGVSNEPQFQSIGKYKIVGTLGRGSMGVVYKGQDPEIGRLVAIKTLRKITSAQFHDPGIALEQFKIEARSAGNLRHPNIITVFDVNIEGDTPYIVMDYVDGESIDTVLLREGKFAPKRTVKYLDQIASGLDAAHEKGIIHRDIKPSNLIIDAHQRVYILDFGVAKMNERITDTESSKKSEPVMGTPGYMSPEQILNEKLDPRSDLFSFAIVAFECFTGKRPFSGENFTEIVGNILNSDPLSLRSVAPELPVKLEDQFLRAFAKRREERFPSAGELMAAMKLALGIRRSSTHTGRGIPGIEEIQRDRKPSEWKSIPGTRPSLESSTFGSVDESEGGQAPSPRADSWEEDELTPVLQSKPVQRPLSSPGYHHSGNPGNIFKNDNRVVGLAPGGFRRRSMMFRLFTVSLILVCVGLGVGIYFASQPTNLARIDPQGITPNQPSAQGSTSGGSEKPAGPLELPDADPIPEGKTVTEMGDGELLGVIMSKQMSELIVLKALKEAKARRVPKLLEAVVVPLDSDSYVVRIETIKLISELQDKRIVPTLLTKLDDHDPLVRKQVALALGELGSRKALGYLSARYLTEEVRDVKQEIRRAIEKINGYPMSR